MTTTGLDPYEDHDLTGLHDQLATAANNDLGLPHDDALVYTYDYASNWWVGPDGQRITQEEMTARMARPHPRAPRMVDHTREVTE